MKKRTAILNDWIYEISESTYKKIMATYKLKKPFMFFNEKREAKLHAKRCKLIRENGKLLVVADVMVRDD